MMGQLQDPGLQKVIEQINTTFGSKRNRDTVELSQKAQALLETNLNKTKETEKEDVSDYQKYPEGVPAE